MAHDRELANSQQASERKKSEFIKRVEDFARYMWKEYIEDGDGKSLLISAVDRSDKSDLGSMVHVILGNKELVTASLVSMMKQKELAGIFRMARIINSEADNMVDVIEEKSRRLRRLYALLASCVIWILAIVVFCVLGCSWITAVSCLLLMGFLLSLIVHEIKPLRQQIRRIKADVQEDLKESLKQDFSSFFNEMMRRSEMNDDE